jgi:nucleotide-binding universal stress UspA family protein
MKTMKRILVALDFSDTDYRLLEYVKLLGEKYPIEKVYFFHVSPGLRVPEYAIGMEKEFDLPPLDEQFKKEMKSRVGLKIRPGLFEAEYDIVEGPVTEQLLHWAEIKKVDLVILGKKKRPFGSGNAARRFLRKSRCSVIFVPEEMNLQVRTLLVPTDFSDNSTLALKQAISLAKDMTPQPIIRLISVYEIPSGLYTLPPSRLERYGWMLRDNLNRYYEKYIKEIDHQGVSIVTEFIENAMGSVARHIHQYALDHKADWIILGAQGHSALASFLLGSVTERMLSYNEEVPLMVVRPPIFKGKEMLPSEKEEKLIKSI